MVARLVRNEEARGSNPLSSTRAMGDLCSRNTVNRVALVVLRRFAPRAGASPPAPPLLGLALAVAASRSKCPSVMGEGLTGEGDDVASLPVCWLRSVTVRGVAAM